MHSFVVAAFLTGIAGFQFQSDLPAGSWWLLVILVPFACKGHFVIRLLAIIIAGWLWAWAHACYVANTTPADLIQAGDVLVTGKVVSLPAKTNHGIRFFFEGERVQTSHGWEAFPYRIRLHWYSKNTTLRLGEHWQLLLRLKPAHGLSNPGGMDYEKWLYQQRIRLTGYVRTDPRNQRHRDRQPHYLHSARQFLADKLQQALEGRPQAGLVRALAVGDRSAVSNDQWKTLRFTGTNHLMAISGLHIGMVAAGVFFLGVHLASLTGLSLVLPAPKFAALLCIVFCGLYACLAGLSLPTQRAYIMLCIAMFALLAGRTLRPTSILAITLGIILLTEPEAVLSSGFWLSFGAVACLLFLSLGRNGTQPGIWQWGRLQVFLLLGLSSLLIILVKQLALYSAIANGIAIPWVGFLVLPFVLTGSLISLFSEATGEWLLSFAESSLGMLWKILDWIASLPFAVWYTPEQTPPALVAAILGVFFLLSPSGWPTRWIGILCLLPLFLIKPTVPAHGSASVTVLDVGQGLAVVIQTRHHTLLYDTGPGTRTGFNTGTAVIAPFLHHQGIAQLDGLMLSHGDNDHVGGLQGVLSDFAVKGSVWSGTPAAIHYPGIRDCSKHEAWEWDGVSFEILSTQKSGRRSDNNASCVLRIANQAGASVLLPGDIERSTERLLLDKYGTALASSVLVAAHHGSATSSSLDFIRTVRPQVVVYSAGFKNRWQFPRQNIVQRFQGLGVQQYSTADSGAVSFQLLSSGNIGQLSQHRIDEKRYWHHLVSDLAQKMI